MYNLFQFSLRKSENASYISNKFYIKSRKCNILNKKFICKTNNLKQKKNKKKQINNASSRTSRFDYFSEYDEGDFSVLDPRSLRRRQRFNRRTLLQPLLQRQMNQNEQDEDEEEEEEEEEEQGEEDEEEQDENDDDNDDDDQDGEGFNLASSNSGENIMISSNNQDQEDEEDEDDDTITESFSRSRVDIYRLAIRTNSEILEDLAAIIRILRQINAIYRVFHNSNDNLGGFLRLRRSRRSRLYSSDTSDEDDDNNEQDDEEEEEANKLLEAGLEDLQEVLSTDNTNNKKQSTLALLALITFQYSHCSDDYLKRYLDPNGEFNPTLAIFAAATYDDDDNDQSLKSCRDIILAAEELYGPDWLKEFHKGKEGALRKMLEKLTFVAKIRLKVRDLNIPPVIR